MVNEENRLIEKKNREDEHDYYRKRQLRDEVDANKKQFIQMKAESQRIIENQQRQNYVVLQEKRVQKINDMSSKVSSEHTAFYLFYFNF